ncbi:hypothetical protein V6N11_080273 [Hibiscus sabdariffa]|uniref:Reverse transcriptase zinc-binding domain-containing protein n=1 Tax=Hibiscus sabdariffa TaxID=183260 RepID=A0ABR2R7K2_9ROSI
MVADMVTATGEWDSDRLRDLLPSTVLEYMAATPLPLARLGDDVPGWRWDEKRQFQVSSAYAVLMEVGERRHASSWSKIWSLQVPQRVRVFMWITALRRHLTNVERVRRHIASSDVCSLCHGGPKDIDHVLRFCTKACELWRCVLGQEVANNFDEWLHGNITRSLVANVERGEWGMRFSVFCWLLWKRRCSMVLDGDFVERESVLDRGNHFILECKAAYSQLHSVPMAVHRREQWWEGPQRGWVKGNVDAAVNVNDGRAAVGGVFRDESGEIFCRSTSGGGRTCCCGATTVGGSKDGRRVGELVSLGGMEFSTGFLQLL